MLQPDRIAFWLQEYALQLRQNPKSEKAAANITRHFLEDACANPDDTPKLHDLFVDAALWIEAAVKRERK
jgi:hypothetical protein